MKGELKEKEEELEKVKKISKGIKNNGVKELSEEMAKTKMEEMEEDKEIGKSLEETRYEKACGGIGEEEEEDFEVVEKEDIENVEVEKSKYDFKKKQDIFYKKMKWRIKRELMFENGVEEKMRQEMEWKQNREEDRREAKLYKLEMWVQQKKMEAELREKAKELKNKKRNKEKEKF